MPIRAELRIHYGRTWRKETRPRILARAGNCCESCKKPDRSIVETITGKHRNAYYMYWRFPDLVKQPANPTGIGGNWLNHQGLPITTLLNLPTWSEPRDLVVILTVGHLNNVAGDDRDENLRAWCQWCHLIYDLEHHHHTRADRKDAERPLLTVAARFDQITG